MFFYKNDSSNSQNLGSYGFRFFLSFIFNFCFDLVELLSIINLSNYRNKSNTSVFLRDLGVTFPREGEDVAFRPTLNSILFIYGVAESKR